MNAEFKDKNIKILVVDDLPPNLKLAQALLDKMGIEGDYAANGQEAVELIKMNHYDLVFMDISMPILNGLQATQQIRMNISKDLPIVALTGSSVERAEEKSELAGMTDYLEKPIDTEKLKAKILKYVKDKLK